MKESEFITVKSHWILLLLSARRKYPSFDSWWALASLTHPLSHDVDMTKWSLMMDQIKDSIFCLSDISMSKLFAGEVLFQLSCRLTTHWNNYVPTLMFAAEVPVNPDFFFLGFLPYSILYLHTSTKWVPTQALSQTLVLHALLAIALELTFDPQWGHQRWCWGTRWCSSFSPGAICSSLHSYLYSSRVENLNWSFSYCRGQRRGSCVEERGSCSLLSDFAVTMDMSFIFQIRWTCREM